MPKLGDRVPNFSLPNQDGKMVSLSDFKGKKLVIFAFPKADTPGCNNQACHFKEVFDKFQLNKASVLGISPDKIEDLKAWKEKKQLPYDLLSDVDHKLLNEWEAWGKKLFGLIPVPFATRSFWVINEEGILVASKIDIDPEESVTQALEAVMNF
ncbi:thioredoxin-dependent thiol peroxidase [Anaerolineales bacterium]